MISNVMLVLDVNILVYAHDLDSSAFIPCRDWLESVMHGRERVGLPSQTLLPFVRLITDARVCKRPLSTARACKVIGGWLSRPHVHVIEPGRQFWSLFADQLLVTRLSGRKVPDVALACLAFEQGARLCTTDRDFARFAGLELINPLR